MEEKIEEILCEYCTAECPENRIQYILPCTECEQEAKQIADLYQPPEEAKLTIDEIWECSEAYTAESKAIWGSNKMRLEKNDLVRELPSVYERIADKAAAKAKLFYEPKGDKEGLADCCIDCERKNESVCYQCLEKPAYMRGAKAQQALDNEKMTDLGIDLHMCSEECACLSDELAKNKRQIEQHQKEIAEILSILGDMTDSEDCYLDHHGYCQNHSYLQEGECPNARAKRILKEKHKK